MIYRTKFISFLAPKIWEFLPNEIKDSGTLQHFKAKLKRWEMGFSIYILYI